jgi:hypothetical protein
MANQQTLLAERLVSRLMRLCAGTPKSMPPVLDLCTTCPLLLAPDQDRPLRRCADHDKRLRMHLAKIAAVLAGRPPAEMLTIEYDEFVAFDDFAWRYPDFVQRAERAFTELAP